nr:MAG TPA: hypothetical protein [Caudoviricetes sp.]
MKCASYGSRHSPVRGCKGHISVAATRAVCGGTCEILTFHSIFNFINWVEGWFCKG